MLAFVEALGDADTALCKNKGVAFFGWLYHSLGGASLKLVTPPRFGNPAMESLLKEATTACQRINKAAPSDRKDAVNRITSAAARERTAVLKSLLDLAGEWRLLDSLSARLRGETAQRVVPARGSASAAGGGGGADETTPREVVHLRQLTAQIQKDKHEASAAMVKLELDIRDAVRERDCVNQNRARMLWRRIAARGSRCTPVLKYHLSTASILLV